MFQAEIKVATASNEAPCHERGWNLKSVKLRSQYVHVNVLVGTPIYNVMVSEFRTERCYFWTVPVRADEKCGVLLPSIIPD